MRATDINLNGHQKPRRETGRIGNFMNRDHGYHYGSQMEGCIVTKPNRTL